MQTEFDHMTTDALQMWVTCTENASRLTWAEQQKLRRAEDALRGRKVPA